MSPAVLVKRDRLTPESYTQPVRESSLGEYTQTGYGYCG